MNKPKTLKQLAESRGKKVLIEDFAFLAKDVEIDTKPVFFESSGKKYEAFAILRNVPVTRFVENANGRIYPRKLWERICKGKYAEGTDCLADHPSEDSDGSVKDTVGVWHNFRVMDEHGIADLYLIDEVLGKKLINKLKAGGSAGMSSVGFGELQEDDKTVDPETYELVRLADWVLFPSQGVFATQENLTESIKSNTNKTGTLKESNNTATDQRGQPQMEQLIISNLRNQSRQHLREGKKALSTGNIAVLTETKTKLQDFLESISSTGEYMAEDRAKVSEQLEAINSTLEASLFESQSKLAKNTADYAKLSEKYDITSKILSGLKEKHNKLREAAKLMIVNEKTMKSDIEKSVKVMKVMESDIKRLVEERKLIGSDMKQLAYERSSMLDDIKCFLENEKTMLSDIDRLVKESKQSKKVLAKYKEAFEKQKAQLESLKKENAKIKSRISEEDEEIEFPDQAEIDPYEVQVDEYADEPGSLQVDDAMSYAADDEDMGLPYSGEDYGIETYEESRKLTESKQVIRVKPEIKAYYEKEVRRKPALKQVREQILTAKSLVSAVNIVNKFNEKLESKPIKLSSIMESQSRRGWLGKSR